MDIRQLPAQDDRVETGPVQFGDDWPGVFIRGDAAGYFAMTLRAFLEGGYDLDADAIARLQLVGLQQLLAGAIVGPAADAVRMPSNARAVAQPTAPQE